MCLGSHRYEFIGPPVSLRAHSRPHLPLACVGHRAGICISDIIPCQTHTISACCESKLLCGPPTRDRRFALPAPREPVDNNVGQPNTIGTPQQLIIVGAADRVLLQPAPLFTFWHLRVNTNNTWSVQAQHEHRLNRNPQLRDRLNTCTTYITKRPPPPRKKLQHQTGPKQNMDHPLKDQQAGDPYMQASVNSKALAAVQLLLHHCKHNPT